MTIEMHGKTHKDVRSAGNKTFQAFGYQSAEVTTGWQNILCGNISTSLSGWLSRLFGCRWVEWLVWMFIVEKKS